MKLKLIAAAVRRTAAAMERLAADGSVEVSCPIYAAGEQC